MTGIITPNIKTLFSVFLKLDFRDSGDSGKKKVLGILLMYLFVNTLFSLNASRSYDEISFVIVSLSTNAFMIAFVVLNDFANLFFSRKHVSIISSLPVSQREIFSAKFCSAAVFISFFAFAIIIPQVSFYYGYGESIISTILFVFTALTFAVFITSLMLVLYTLAVKFFAEKANNIVYFIQVLFLAYVMFSSSMGAKVRELGKKSLLEIDIMNYLPQTFYAKAMSDYFLFIILVPVSFVTFYIFFKFMSGSYYSLSEKIYALPARKKKAFTLPGFSAFGSLIYRVFLKDNTQRAFYNLTKWQFKNSRTMRLRFIPLMLIPLIFAIIGILSGIPGFLLFKGGQFPAGFRLDSIPIISPAITFSYILCIRMLISNTKISQDNSGDVSWLYDSLPETGSMRALNGVLKFIFFNFVIPVFILMTIFLSVKINAGTVLLNLIYIISAALFVGSIARLLDKTYPFTLDSTKSSSASRFFEVILTMMLGILIFVSQIFMFKNLIFVLVSILVMLIISYLLYRK